MIVIARFAIAVSAVGAILAGSPTLGWANLVVGTFNATRAGNANLETGALTVQSRNSLAANFPGLSYATTTTLTSPFLAGVDILAITPVLDTVTGITPLSVAEQTALLDFALNGGSVVMFADGFLPYIPAAQSMVGPFGLTIADDGVANLQFCTQVLPTHPIFSGPFGQVSTVLMNGAGNFTGLGAYATDLADMTSTGKSTIAVIEAGMLGPGSGRVVAFADASLFGDVIPGIFAAHEALFLNTFQYLVPEPSTFVLLAAGMLALAACGWAKPRAGDAP